jgi:hypothetical protein
LNTVLDSSFDTRHREAEIFDPFHEHYSIVEVYTVADSFVSLPIYKLAVCRLQEVLHIADHSDSANELGAKWFLDKEASLRLVCHKGLYCRTVVLPASWSSFHYG